MLVDGFGRAIDYVRVSVTDRCDMRCVYCLPKGFRGFEVPANWLTSEELSRLVNVFARLGVSKVRLTGGEPLLRRDVTAIVAAVASTPGIVDLSMTTNGAHLAGVAHALFDAGLHRLNVSLDTLDADKFARITSRDCLRDVLAGLHAARAAGFTRTKLNAVVTASTTYQELCNLLRFAIDNDMVLRLIEHMPVGHAHLAQLAVNLTETGESLARDFGLCPQLNTSGSGPARYWRSAEQGELLGVITPLSRHFCEACNRVRLSVDGTLYPCLGHNSALSLGSAMRAGASDQDLESLIRDAVRHKPERHEFAEKPGQIVRFMASTGG